MEQELGTLKDKLEGELFTEKMMQVIYATDASVYRELPLAVAFPKHAGDVQELILFANQHKLGLIPRAAGTSLAGQCVGSGIVVDCSKHMNQIIELNIEEQWVRVEPGVIRNSLNDYLRPHGFFFSPITSTANRATIGGMVGNNSSGTTSIQYGTTREHVLELEVLLSDGSTWTVNQSSLQKRNQEKNALACRIMDQMQTWMEDSEIQEEIRAQFPHPKIHRRNTGYALDALIDTDQMDLCKLLTGSEGTLAFTTAIKIHIDPLPPKEAMVVALHCDNLDKSLRATQVAMQFNPSACELMDKIILDCTKENKDQLANRFFVQGDPVAVLCVEFRAESQAALQEQWSKLEAELKQHDLVYAHTLVYGKDIQKVWKLRSAGLGLLANIPGDKKAVACIEDTAVHLDDLPAYIQDFTKIMNRFNQRAVYYAHAGAGELHLRPILNLKDKGDVDDFYQITLETAKLVKRYKGSFSGEHGDGRVRAGFLKLLVGDKNYALFEQVKKCWDPHNIFNPEKIVHAPPMTNDLRYEPGRKERNFETILDFSSQGGILRSAEQCNGSGDCRKLPEAGGTMCPSYQATRNEKDTTRARANVIREFLTQSTKQNPFDHEEIKEVLDLCLSCKACASECPSNVDMASLKAEFLYQYQKQHGFSLRTKAFAYINQLNKLAAVAPWLYNGMISNRWSSKRMKQFLRVAPERSLPALSNTSWYSWYQTYRKQKPIKENLPKVYMLCDEFTNLQELELGKSAVLLLERLNYQVLMIRHGETGRAAISKGMLDYAKKRATDLVEKFAPLVNESSPLIGVEPSCILGFRDEYPRLVDKKLRTKAEQLKEHSYTIEEFLSAEIRANKINADQFTDTHQQIIVHGHCHQKALSNMEDTMWMLNLPKNYSAELLATGCCGMAGSFGYEEEHYNVSMQVAELQLFPAIRKRASNTLIAASGTSCRHQIHDGLAEKAQHPVQILYDAMK